MAAGFYGILHYTGINPNSICGDGYYNFCTNPGTYYLRFVTPPTWSCTCTAQMSVAMIILTVILPEPLVPEQQISLP